MLRCMMRYLYLCFFRHQDFAESIFPLFCVCWITDPMISRSIPISSRTEICAYNLPQCIMSCITFSMQSLMPSLFGFPADAQVLQCSNYGSTAGTYANNNGIRSQFSDTVVPSNQVTADPWLNHLQGVMTGAGSVVLRPISAEDQAMQNLGVSFLPWNRRPYDRTTFGTNSRDGTVYPFNPWNSQTMMDNGMTVTKIAGISLGAYYGSKIAYNLYKKR